jgi:prenyltransferase beta subunit
MPKLRMLLACMLVAAQMISVWPMASALADSSQQMSGTRTVTVQQAIQEAASWLLAQGPVKEDWDALALSQAGITISSSYLNAAREELGGFDSKTLPTGYARLILGVKAAGGNPEALNGVNLIDKIVNHPTLDGQGTNGVIYGLLALNSGSYTISNNALWNQTKMIDWLLQHQAPSGGWSLFTTDLKADVDITGAALWALAPYTSRTDVQTAVANAIAVLADRQFTNGDVTQSRTNSNSLAMVIIGLSAVQTDGRSGAFNKAEGNLVSALFNYFRADGSFALVAGGAADRTATNQALLALVAFKVLTGGQGGSFEAPVGGGNDADKASVYIHIEKPDGTLAEGIESASRPLEALQLLTARNSIDIVTRETPFFDVYQIGSIHGVSTPNYLYWGFNVKRNGSWTDAWDWNNTELKDGDELVIFYGPFGVSSLLDTIELTPESPIAGEPFSVKVKQFSFGQSVTSNVYVQVGSNKVWSDSQGVASFPQGYSVGDDKIVVTGALADGYPTVIRGVKQLQPNVSVRVEGPQFTLASKKTTGSTPFAALSNTVSSVVYDDGQYFAVNVINGIEPSDYDWWGFAVRRGGAWIPTDAWNTTRLQSGDELLVYYSTGDTQLVHSAELDPPVLNAGQGFTVKVNKEDWQGTVTAASNVTVQIGSQTKQTNEEGIATFAGLPSAGQYEISISGHRPDTGPMVAKLVTNVTVGEAVVVQPGNPGNNPASNSILLNVVGDSAKGEIVTGQRIQWQSGDTPYSVLVKALGSDSVVTAGKGDKLYVAGVEGLSELDKGAKSGWKYAVNCSFPSSSAGVFVLNNNDRVDWMYTLDNGADVEAIIKNSCQVPAGATAGSGSSGAASRVTTDMEKSMNELPISFDNVTPVDGSTKTVNVLNAENRMTADASESLKQALSTNTVSVSKLLLPGQTSVVADFKEEAMLEVSSQAATSYLMVSIQELGSTTPASGELLSSMYEFGPNGTTFTSPVYVSIMVPLGEMDLEQLALVWLNEQSGQWIPIPAVVDASTGIVTGKVDHFTKFAVIDKSKLEASAEQPPAGTPESVIDQSIEKAAAYVLADPDLSDWEAYALATAGRNVPASYLTAVENELKERGGKLRLVTDYERHAVGILAAGGNPRSFAGYDLIDSIVNNSNMLLQGTNGPIFALHTINKGGYDIASDAQWTAERLIASLLKSQNQNGGWPLVDGDPSNVDLTGMALLSLAPYQSRSDVKEAIDTALLWLSKEQQPSGGYLLEGVENAESIAQVVMALAALNINELDPRFVKNGISAIQSLLAYQQPDGGFAHMKGQGSGSIPTEQAMLALAMVRNNGGKPAAAPPALPQFADQADIAAWALPFVNKAYRYGLMEGVSEKELRFAPAGKLTRAEFVTIVLRLLQVKPNDPSSSAPFADVQPDSWYYLYVAEAAKLQLVNGVSDEEFAPNQYVTREQMAQVIARAFKLDAGTLAPVKPAFTDLHEANSGAIPAIQAVQAGGYMEGDDSGRFQPNEALTREMAAAVIVRAYEKMIK